MNTSRRPGLYFHTFWSRPQTSDPRSEDGADLVLPDYEALTWLVSALEGRRHGRMKLVTDRRGLQFIRNVGLDWVYSGGISTELDDIPPSINPLVFWSAGKLFAWKSMSEPAVSLDPDAICWEPVEAAAPVVALHTEELGSADYAFQQHRYARFGFTGTEWDWTDEPINAGVLCLADLELARSYSEKSIGFMLEYSRALERSPAASEPPIKAWPDAMLFAEQRLIVLMMRRHGRSGVTLGQFDSRRHHLAPNSRCLHLWGTKRFYLRCREARAAYVNFLINHVRNRFPEAIPTLHRWRLDQPITPESLPPDPPSPFPVADIRDAYCRIGRLQGSLYLQDANLPALRRAYEGSTVGPAESLCPEPGTTFELIEVRHEPNPDPQVKPSESHATPVEIRMPRPARQ